MTLKDNGGSFELSCDCPSCHVSVLAISEDDAVEIAALEGWHFEEGEHICHDCTSGNCPGTVAAIAKAAKQAQAKAGPGQIPAMIVAIGPGGPQVIGVGVLDPSNPGQPVVGMQGPGDEPDDADADDTGAEDDTDPAWTASMEKFAAEVEANTGESADAPPKKRGRKQPIPSSIPIARGSARSTKNEGKSSPVRGSTLPGVTQTSAEARAEREPPAPAQKLDKDALDETNELFGEIDQLIGMNRWDPSAKPGIS